MFLNCIVAFYNFSNKDLHLAIFVIHIWLSFLEENSSVFIIKATIHFSTITFEILLKLNFEVIYYKFYSNYLTISNY